VARTKTQLRQSTVDQLEVPKITGTAGGSGSSTSTLRDNDLERFADNDLIGAWLYLTSGSPTHTNVRITDNVQSTGIVTYRPTQAAAPDLLTYEILPYEADAMHTALEESMQELFDAGVLVRNIWLDHWLTGSPIYNSTFEYWTSASAVDGWTVGTCSVSRRSYSSDHIVPAQNAARLSAVGTLLLDAKYSQFLQDLSGDTVTLRAWVRTGTGTNSRAQLLVDGRDDDAVVASTGYHSGDGQWELVSSDGYSIADSATQITIRLQNSAAATGDFGAVWLEGGTRIREYPFPIGMAPSGPDAVYSYRVSVDDSNKVSSVNPTRLSGVRYAFNKYRYDGDELGVLELQSTPSNMQVLRMPTSVPLSLPSANSSNVEVTTMDGLLLAKMAASKLLLKDMMHGPVTFRQRASERANILLQEVRQLADGRGATASNAVPLSPTW
jgi:hypothetical protein